jgi:hypothetical protein
MPSPNTEEATVFSTKTTFSIFITAWRLFAKCVLTLRLYGHASALTGKYSAETTTQTLRAGNYAKMTARGHGQHQTFVRRRSSYAWKKPA